MEEQDAVAHCDCVRARLRSDHSPLAESTLVFVQGELSTREYDRTINVPNGKKSIEHVIQQLAVELKADMIRILDRSNNSEQPDVTEPADEDRVPS